MMRDAKSLLPVRGFCRKNIQSIRKPSIYPVEAMIQLDSMS